MMGECARSFYWRGRTDSLVSHRFTRDKFAIHLTQGIFMTNQFAHPDRNLALELVRSTEAAAIRAHPFIGRGDKNAADGAAVDAMRKFLGTVNF